MLTLINLGGFNEKFSYPINGISSI
jgi:hypothetical protein